MPSPGTARRNWVAAVSEPAPDDCFDLVLVPVRAEQLPSTLAVLTGMTDASDVLFFGNTGNRVAELAAALGERAMFGFPAADGTRDGPTVKYVLIRQQKTMLGEPDGTTTSRIRHLQHVLDGAGFPTLISVDIAAWLLGHAAFVVPMAFALYRVGIDAPRLAADPDTMRLMVLATREAFTALHAAGNDEIPMNLRALLPAADGSRHRLLAAGAERPQRGTVVRRTQPSRPRGDVRARRGPARGDAPHGAPDTQPRAITCHPHVKPTRYPASGTTTGTTAMPPERYASARCPQRSRSRKIRR